MSSVIDGIVLKKKMVSLSCADLQLHMLVNFKFNILALNLTFWIHLLTNSL